MERKTRLARCSYNNVLNDLLLATPVCAPLSFRRQRPDARQSIVVRPFRTSMSTQITASFRWSKNEFLRAQRLALRHSSAGAVVLYRLMPAIGVLILLSGIVQLYQHTTGWPGVVFTLLFSSLFFSMPFFARRTALKLYAQKPDRDMEVRWDISNDGIRSKTELASSENTWAFFQKALRVREGFLLYPGGSVFHWLPMHAFRDTADVERFAELVKSNVRDYVQAV